MTVINPVAFQQGGTYTARHDRLHLVTSVFSTNDPSGFSARGGFINGRVPNYSNPAGWNITVGPFAAVVQNGFAALAGDYIVANPDNAGVVLTASSPTTNRYDIVGVRVQDNFYDGLGANTGNVVVVQGTPSAGTPSDPSLPLSFLPIMRAVVNAGSSAPVLQDLRVRTAPLGGLVPVANVAERALILNPQRGQSVMRLDRNWTEVWDGTTWRVQGVGVVTSEADLTNITSPYTGQMVFNTGNNMFYRWTGSVWLACLATGGNTTQTRHEARYRQTGTGQTINTATDQRVNFNTVDYDSLDIAASTVSGGTEFTFQRGGLWLLNANARFVANASQLERAMSFGKSPTGVGERHSQSGVNPVGGTWAGSVSTVISTASAQTASVWMYTTVPVSLQLDLLGTGVNASMTWLRPQ